MRQRFTWRVDVPGVVTERSWFEIFFGVPGETAMRLELVLLAAGRER